MGIVLGVEAAVSVAEAAEAAAGAVEAGEAIGSAAEAGEAIGSAAEAGEAIGSAAEAGEAAGEEAGDGAAAAAESGGDALQTALETLTKGVEKLGKMVANFARIDQIFKAAKAILEPLIASDPSARAKVEKLTKLIEVLTESSYLLDNLTDWLKVDAQGTNDLKNFTVTTRAVLSKFIPRLGAAVGVLMKLSQQIVKENAKKQPITDGEIYATEHSLLTVLDCYKSLADFKAKHQAQVPNLVGMPIDEEMVFSVQAKMP